MALNRSVDAVPSGLPIRQMGSFVPGNSSTALPLSLTTEWLYLKARTANTDTIWMGTSAGAATSTLGFGIFSTTELWLPIDATSLTLYFQSAGGSSTIDYVALGK
jgi:hypothetical protein